MEDSLELAELQRVFGDWAGVFGGGDTVTIAGEPRAVSWLFSRLARCADVMPAALCAVLDMDDGATFAQGIRKVRASQRPPRQVRRTKHRA